ncbi:hypothetical protein ACG74X_20025 [Marivita sp. S0852]|uniref:hypothetical protein n=1 Tax=Marivita sp. S0852 TaxID=3373893 RepID=UPI0039822B01
MTPEYSTEDVEYPLQLLEHWPSATNYQRDLMIEISRAHARGWFDTKRILIHQLKMSVSTPEDHRRGER